MTSSSDQPPERTGFLVERYLAPAEAGQLSSSVARTARLCGDPGRTGPVVEYLRSAYLPTDDTCFCLFRAASADSVRAVNDEAGFALDRITPAVLLLGDLDHPFDVRRST